MINNRNIRHYRPGDAQTIVEIYNSAFGSNPPFFSRTEESWLWRYVSRPGFDPESVLIAEEAGKAVSSLVMTYAMIRIAGIPRKVALIDDVTTLPEYRGKGHATALIECALDIARKKECYVVHLTANPKESAIRIYEKLGFSIIADLNLMESILHVYDLTKAVGFRLFIPALFLNSWMRLKEKHAGKIEIEIVSGATLKKAFITSQKNYPSRSGLIIMDEEYLDWMILRRPVGKIIGLTATVNNELVGMVSISVHTMKIENHQFKIGSIANLIISDKFWTNEVLTDFLQTARSVAKDTLGCALANIAVDSRDITLNNACRHSRFYPLSSSAAMVHPLMKSDRLSEIKRSLWSQPLETMVADP
jgi:ribosomal protein S18 acetylase RimI-like enzyme